MDDTDAHSLRRAGRRLVIGSVLLALVSFCYYAADEVAFTYRELDGYLPILPIVRLGLAIVAGGLLLALVYPIRVLAVRLPPALRSQRGSDVSGPPSARSIHFERALDAALSLVVLGGVCLLVRKTLALALLPLPIVDAIEQAVVAAGSALAILLVLLMLWELRTARS